MSTILPFTEDNLSLPGASYVEPKKTTPKIISKLPPARAGDGETISLSFDQVNDDADELVELRGGGRYFGVTDPTTGDSINAQQSLGPLCGNCHKRGHIRSKCKVVVCHKCGVIGDHYETQCPTTVKCSKCGENGHLTSMCTSKTRKKTYCKSCDTFNHDDSSCPSIWRSYITKGNKDDEESLVLPLLFCYNCASQDHYGDECLEYRVSRVPNFGSAFSGSNLPKSMRPLYFHKLASRDSRSGGSGGSGGSGTRSTSGRSDYKPNNSGQLPPKRRDNRDSRDNRDNFNKRDFNNNSRDYQDQDTRNFNNSHFHSRDFNFATDNRNFNTPYNTHKSFSENNNSSKNFNNNKNFSNSPINTNKNYNSKVNKPSRSGVISNGKVYSNSRPARPSRTGFIDEKKKKSKNIRNLY